MEIKPNILPKIEEQVDPKTTSFLESKMELEPDGDMSSGDKFFRDRYTGELYIKIPTTSERKNEVEKQRFITSLVRPVINYAQVVKVGGEYYSHVQNLENVKSEEDEAVSFVADRVIMRSVWNDWDHVPHKKVSHISREDLPEVDVRQNVGFDKGLDKYYFYDAGNYDMKMEVTLGLRPEFGDTSRLKRVSLFTKEGITAFVKSVIDYEVGAVKNWKESDINKKQIYEKVINKCNQLLSMFREIGPKTLESFSIEGDRLIPLTEEEKTSGEDQKNVFIKESIERLEFLKKYIEDIIKSV